MDAHDFGEPADAPPQRDRSTPAQNPKPSALPRHVTTTASQPPAPPKVRNPSYITNDWKLTADQVIGEAHQRCNQENLIANLKSGVRALHAPVNTLYA